jgi:phosphatidate cytidylyltransferase
VLQTAYSTAGHSAASTAILSTTPDAPAQRQTSSREWLVGLVPRAITAFTLIPVVIALVWFGGWVAFAAAAVVLALCVWELRVMFTHRGWRPVMALSGGVGIAFLVAAMLPPYRMVIVGLAISALVVGSMSWLMLSRPHSIEGALVDWALTVSAPLYIGWPVAFILLLRGGVYGYQSNGFWWLLTVFFAVWAFDTFAFFAGHYFGHTKLAPRISPKKTWEGVAGGLVFAVAAALVLTRPIGIAWYHAVAIGVLVSIAATLGDLAESVLKRETGVKDSGAIMWGHGGVLDRIDSLLFSVIVVFFYALFLHSIAL